MATVITPKKGEELLLTLRKNPNKFARQILIFSAFVVVAVLLFTFVQNQYIDYLALAVTLIGFCYGLYYFLIWFYDVYIITNARVITVFFQENLLKLRSKRFRTLPIRLKVFLRQFLNTARLLSGQTLV